MSLEEYARNYNSFCLQEDDLYSQETRKREFLTLTLVIFFHVNAKFAQISKTT